MMSRLKGRIEAAESKAGIRRQDNRINLFFVEGWPEDGASEFLKKAGHDLSIPPNRLLRSGERWKAGARAYKRRHGAVWER